MPTRTSRPMTIPAMSPVLELELLLVLVPMLPDACATVVGDAVLRNPTPAEAGLGVGSGVGNRVGSGVGSAVGCALGSSVGSRVGCALGSGVGSDVGLDVVGVIVAGATVTGA